MIRINLRHDSTNSEHQQKAVFILAAEMAEDYNIPRQYIPTIISDHLKELSRWINLKYETQTQAFTLGHLAYGIEFLDDAFLTMLLLKVPADKLR